MNKAWNMAASFGLVWLGTVISLCAGGTPVEPLEQKAFEAAVARVAPAVVRIETVGGLDRVDGVLFGPGPTTGLVVDPSGYILSSAFNFVNQPTSILVRLPEGDRKPAKLVATDHSRMLVLLKIDVQKPLPSCEIAPYGEMRVGQWAIAVGRTFEANRTNMAVGVLSALDRIWGKAVQTDAAVSPNNYGGPLIDLRGRVLGVLVPLSPDAAGEAAGVEWYDSGIGFAVPLEHMMQVLPRLKKGQDLHPGLAGISLQGTNVFTGQAVVAACHPKSPAAAAGIMPNDRIVEMDGRPIRRAADMKTALGRRYAGDKMTLVVLRGRERIQREIELAAKLEPYQHGFLGILPSREADAKEVAVRYVYPKSPAATAGIAIGDVLVSLGGKPLEGRLRWIADLGAMEPGATVELGIRRGGDLRKVKATLARLPETLPPAELPPAHGGTAPPQTAIPEVGIVALKIPEYANEVWAYVPEKYNPHIPHGVVVWLDKPGGYEGKATLARWKPLCDRHDLILVAPKSADPAHWTPSETALVDRLLMEVGGRYSIDPPRVVVGGYDSGGILAFLSASRNRETIRAVAAVEAAPMGSPPENDPVHRLAVYMASGKKSPVSRAMDRAAGILRKKGIPVTEKATGDAARHLNAAEWAELARWIDALDRI